MSVPSPQLPLDHPDRALCCEEAMEARFDELFETGDVTAVFFEALDAGWTEHEVRRGLRGLIAAHAVAPWHRSLAGLAGARPEQISI